MKLKDVKMMLPHSAAKCVFNYTHYTQFYMCRMKRTPHCQIWALAHTDTLSHCFFTQCSSPVLYQDAFEQSRHSNDCTRSLFSENTATQRWYGKNTTRPSQNQPRIHADGTCPRRNRTSQQPGWQTCGRPELVVLSASHRSMQTPQRSVTNTITILETRSETRPKNTSTNPHTQ